MKNHKTNFAEGIWYALAHKLVPGLILILGGTLCFAVVKLLGDPSPHTVQNIVGSLMLGFLTLAFYAKAVLFTLQEKQTYSIADACAYVFYSWTIYLHFLPMIGPYLSKRKARHEEYRNPFLARDKNEA